MLKGKKSIAFTNFYNAMDIVAEKTGDNPHEVWKKGLDNIYPQVEVRSRRVGGSTFQIPTEIRNERRISVGMKWMIKYCRARSGKGIAEKLAAEIIAASKNEGAAVKKKEDTHRMAEANKAFAHFRA
jgi:small subunit ribosomal protein S7